MMATPTEKVIDIRVAMERDAEIAAAQVLRLREIHDRRCQPKPNATDQVSDR